ncbi:MAG: hypothetical protein BGO04_10665 [Microbacterium sp. 70-38]|nr:MAG: hypothetical protein BGO04_10665 [Microbacterium sp. 70-38]
MTQHKEHSMHTALRWVGVATVGIVAIGLASCSAGSDTGKVTLTFAQFGNSLDDAKGLKDDPIKAAIEKAVGITLKYDTGSEGFDDRMATELAAGTSPDIFPTWDADRFQKWAKDGALLDIAKVVDADKSRYPVLAKVLADPQYQAYNKLYTGDANAAYGIYAVSSLPYPSFAGVPVYNQSILDRFNGGNVPKTIDEFVNFTDAAAANGIAGWWPRNDKLTNWTEIDATMALPQGTSIAPPASQTWAGLIRTGDDTWKLTTTSPESEQVVKQLAAMYKANALDNGVGVKGDFDDAYADFGLGKIASVNFQFGYPGQFRDFWKTAWQQAHPDSAKVTDLAQGVSLQGSAGYPQIYQTSAPIGAFWVVPATTKHPERVVDLLEYLASQKGQDTIFMGIKGKTYNPGSDGQPQYIEGAWNAINKAYGTSDGRGQYVWFDYLFSASSFMTQFQSKSWFDSVTHPVDHSSLWASDTDKQLMERALTTIKSFSDKVVVTLPDYYNLLVLDPKATEIQTKLKEISNRYLAAFIGGQMDIDSGWPKYVAEYKAAGADEYQKIVNAAVKAAKKLGK